MHSFYVLNKGDNSGKPLEQPCTNCFIVTCATASEREFWFWLSWGLWQSNRFHPQLRGSCVQFIAINDYREVIAAGAARAATNHPKFTEAVNTMRLLEQLEQSTRAKLGIYRQYKVAVFRKFLFTQP